MCNLLIICTIFIYIVSAAAWKKDISLDGRIVGGNETNILDYPYHVSVDYRETYKCGGAIISRTWVLTAGACLERSILAEEYSVRIGTTYLGVGGIIFDVSRVIPHPSHNNVGLDYDIGLLQLLEPIPLSRTAQIIGLPDNADAPIEGTIATVTGWGYTVQGGNASTVLQVVQVPIFNHEVCTDLYNRLGYTVTDRMVCAGYWDGGKDACNGDAGGPLVTNFRAVGVVSWGLGCAQPQQLGVYTHVGAFRDWITEVTGI